MRDLIHIVLMILFSLGLPEPSYCSKNEKAEKKYYKEKVEKSLIEKLKLTEDQQYHLDQLDISNEIANLKIKSQILTLKDISRRELLKENPNLSTLDSVAAASGEVYGHLSKISHSHFLEVKKILTPDQFSSLLSSNSRKDLKRAAYGYEKKYTPNATAEDLLGSWRVNEIYTEKGEGKTFNLTYTFRKKGSGETIKNGKSSDFKWSLKDGILVIRFGDYNEKREAWLVDDELWLVSIDQQLKMAFVKIQ
ncbi:hypothetical protein H8D57_00240 [bacterium]|nr:hypothetical protein [bacterium]